MGTALQAALLVKIISKGSHWESWGCRTLRHHPALRWLLPAKLVITVKPEVLAQHYKTGL